MCVRACGVYDVSSRTGHLASSPPAGVTSAHARARARAPLLLNELDGVDGGGNGGGERGERGDGGDGGGGGGGDGGVLVVAATNPCRARALLLRDRYRSSRRFERAPRDDRDEGDDRALVWRAALSPSHQATNRPHVLDDALLRPGRFGTHATRATRAAVVVS